MNALNGIAEEKLTGPALPHRFSDRIGIPHENQPDIHTEAEQEFVPQEAKNSQAEKTASKKAKAPAAKTSKEEASALKPLSD